ncbi:MAG: hypothetical protein ACTSXS_01305 [Candidatus Thorarchaeota archaeon]
MRKKRLLQIWDITCSSAILASYMESRGWRCKVLIRKAFHRHNCSDEFRDYEIIPGGVPRYYLAILKTLLTFRPDLILVRQNYDLLPFIRFFAPRTPIVLQFHGSEVRHRKTLPWQSTIANRRIVSTRDLVAYGTYYGTPIHPMFVPPPKGTRKPGTALFIRTAGIDSVDCLDKAIAFAKENNLQLTVIDRIKGPQVPHKQMPEIFQKHEWYLDLKGLTSSTVLSKTAIEFLRTTSPDAPGKVLTDSGEVLTSFETTTLEEYFDLLESMVKK